MTSQSSASFFIRTVALVSVFALTGTSVLQADEVAGSNETTQVASATPDTAAAQQAPTLTPAQLDTLVAPIALYPDPLLSQIFVASTYPLEVVQAYQWLQQHPELKDKDLTDAAAKQNWDPSVQALVVYPDVMKRLNEDVSWTTNLGNAFLANQGSVMDAVQNMRSKAEADGKLKSTDQVKVENTTDEGKPVVDIEPVSPDVIYVPVYDPYWIWGPPAAYYYPTWYYPPRPGFGWCVWGPGISINLFYAGWGGWGYWGWHPGWYHHTVLVNNSFVVVHNYNVVHVNHVVAGRTAWVHDPVHRMGVAYPNRAVAAHYSPVARAVYSRPRPSPAQVQQGFHQAAVRASARPSYDRVGTRQIQSSSYNRNRSAFGGREAGATARVHSTRGYSSLSHRAAGGARPSGGGSAGHVSGGGGGVSSNAGGGGSHGK